MCSSSIRWNNLVLVLCRKKSWTRHCKWFLMSRDALLKLTRTCKMQWLVWIRFYMSHVVVVLTEGFIGRPTVCWYHRVGRSTLCTFWHRGVTVEHRHITTYSRYQPSQCYYNTSHCTACTFEKRSNSLLIRDWRWLHVINDTNVIWVMTKVQECYGEVIVLGDMAWLEGAGAADWVMWAI